MKKLSFFLMALLVSLTSFAKVMNEVTVPTNAELWEAFKPYYNTYYGLERGDQPIDKVSTFASAKMQEIMTDAASEYKWLGDYVLGVAAGQGVTLPTDMAAANEGAWRWAVHAFFNATTGANGAAGTDFTEAGKPENWGPAYLAAKGGTTPEEPAVVEKEETYACAAGTLADGKVTHDLPCCVIVQEQGESTTALKSVSPWEAPAKSIMTITPKEGVTIKKYVVNTKNTTLGTYLGKAELTNATKTTTSNGVVTFSVTNGAEPVTMKFVSTTIKFHELTIAYTQVGGTVEPEPVKYTVTVAAENGTVTGAGEYAEGAEATLTATAAAGYEFVNWTVDGAEVSTENPYKFIVTANVALVANFKEAAAVEPTLETVYFVNAANWTKVNAYAWEPVQNANWPGVAATKEAEQIAGYDVYSYTVEAGKYANVIFNNGSGQQTADLKWTAGKYYVKDGWYTKEEAEAKLAKPVEYESVYFVDNQGWGKANIYTWTPEVGTWPGVAMTKEAEQLAGYDVYSYTVEKGTSFGGVIFNNGSKQTSDLKWTAGKYYVQNAWYTKEEAEAKLAGPVTPPVITYVLMGVKGDWTTGIALTQNADNANEYVLLGQDIAEGDAVKVVTLTDGVATAWCGNVDEYSVAHSADDMGNIVLAPGKYDFYYKVAEDLIYIGATAPVEPEYETMPIEMTNLEVQDMGEFVLLQASDLSMTGISVMLGVYADGHLHEGSAVDWNGTELPIVEGNITKTVDVEKGDVYAGLVVVQFGEGLMGLDLTMYSAAAEAIELAIEGAEVEVVETTGTLQFTATWTDSTTMVTYPVLVTVAGYEEAEFKEYEGAQISELTIGDDDNWFDFAVADAVAVFKEGNAFALEGEYTSWATGTTYYVAIEGELPVVKFNVTATAENGTVTGAGEYEKGATATLVATPAEDYQFVNWTVGDSIVSTEATYTFVVTENVALVANFELIPVVSLPGRAWAYNLALAIEGTQYTFSFQTSTDANATLVLTNEAGEELDAIELGAVKAGKNKVTLSAKELPTNVTVNWGIKMSGEAITEMVEVTDESRGIYNFYLPQDVAVDNNPLSATFGQIYVIGTDGAADGGSDRADTQKRGVFVYNQYLDELNPTNVGYLPANAAELMTDKSRQAVHRMAVNPVDNHVAFAYNVEGASAIWSMDPANLAGNATNLIEGLAITKANALCFDAEGTLYVLDNANTATGGTIVKVVNGVLDTIAQNAIWGVQDMSLVSDGRGGLWLAQNRWAVDAYAVLSHVNAEGVIDFKVTGESPEEVKALFPNDANASYRGQCSYNVAEDILAFGGNKVVTLFQVSYDETTGVPSIAKILSTPVLGGNIDGVAFDYAGDLYALSASTERLFKFAVPTENNVCTTPAATTFQIKGHTYTDNNLNPYAFDLTSRLSADKSTLTVKYSLNNSKATSVNVVVYNGTEVVATVPGTTNIGKNTVEVATADLPGGVELTWAVEVNGTSVATPTLEEKIYSFYHPSGVDIDNNPENETFGMLLVNEGMQSVVSKTEGYVSAGFGAGIFAFTPSFDLIENSDKPGYNGGIEFTTTRADGTGTAYAPRRIRISEDGRIFVTSLNTDGNYLWEVNAENLNEWTPIFKGTLNDQRELVDAEGNFIAAPNNGFDVKGSGENLQLAMYSVNLSGITAAAMGGFRLHEYNLGTATDWATAPSKAIVEGKYAINYTGTQVEYDNEGGLWIASYRGSATDANPGLVHINAEGVEDAKLVWNNVRQAGIRFNKDFTKLVVAGNNGAAKKATIYTISKDANGAPVLTEEAVVDMAVVGNNLNDFAWDYAGNLYSCGNSSEKLAAWAMPYSGTVETPAAAKYAFELEYTEPVYEVYEDAITNLVIDYDNMLLIGGPSEAFQVEVVLGLGEYNMNEDKFQLLPESSISVLGSEATFVEGYASVDGIDQTASAVVRCMYNGMAIEFHLTMSAAPLEATKVVVENATIEIEKYLLFGDMYDYALKMTGVWSNEGVDYPVLVEVPVYYPEATEPYEMFSTVTVGGWGDEDPWLGFGEGYLTITQEGQKITAAGVVENPMAGIAIDITISGTITPSSVENATVTVKAVKMIKNGQLIISKGDVEYNVQGAVIK